MGQLITLFLEGLELIGVPFAGALLYAMRPTLLLIVAAFAFMGGFAMALVLG